MTDEERMCSILATGMLMGQLLVARDANVEPVFTDITCVGYPDPGATNQLTMTMPTIMPRVLVTVTIEATYDPTLEPF